MITILTPFALADRVQITSRLILVVLRAISPVFLFEEFVPLEYRQQLSAGVQQKNVGFLLLTC